MTLVDFIVDALPEEAVSPNNWNEPLKRNLLSWFGIKTTRRNGVYKTDAEAYQMMRSVCGATDYYSCANSRAGYFTKLQDFLNQQDKTWLGAEKPWMFYNSDWLELTELCYNDKGEPVDESYV